MGNLATPEFLIARWDELSHDPSLQDLPYKIELNSWGKVEMSPASFRHGRLQIALGAELTRQLPDGVAASECPILTRMIEVTDGSLFRDQPHFLCTGSEISAFLFLDLRLYVGGRDDLNAYLRCSHQR